MYNTVCLCSCVVNHDTSPEYGPLSVVSWEQAQRPCSTTRNWSVFNQPLETSSVILGKLITTDENEISFYFVVLPAVRVVHLQYAQRKILWWFNFSRYLNSQASLQTLILTFLNYNQVKRFVFTALFFTK